MFVCHYVYSPSSDSDNGSKEATHRVSSYGQTMDDPENKPTVVMPAMLVFDDL